MNAKTWLLRLLVTCCALAPACASSRHASAANGGNGGRGAAEYRDGGTSSTPVLPFQADPPAVYVAKVKNVLLGLPPTDDEIAQISADPTQFKALVASWIAQPEYTQKMQRFFELAFQQTQISAVDFADQSYPRQIGLNATTIPQLVQNAQESFARTVLELGSEGHPLTEAITTRRFMLTTALRELYAFLDVWQVDDSGKVSDRFHAANPKLSITVEAAQGAIPIAQTLDPTNPNFMHWYDPDVPTAGARDPGCAIDPIVYPANAAALHFLLYGSLDAYKTPDGKTSCRQFAGTAGAAQLTAADFSDWKMLTIREPQAGEAIANFYDLPALRAADELVLRIPRIGFFSTPAFFANWQTNVSNQMRVTLNQALIVALGSSIDGTDSTVTPGDPPPGLDSAHAGSADCYFCHQTLDPLRSILSATYSWNYHDQLDPTWTAQPGMFAFRGVVQPMATVADFADHLAQHPVFAPGWVQKLCNYVNSAPCASDDPEFSRIVSAFSAANYDWNTLVKELVSSPIVTHATETASADEQGEVVAVARRDHLCFALSRRLGLADVCGLDRVTGKRPLKNAIPQIASGLPSDGYGRGAVAPVLPNDPSLFYRAGVENICAALASAVVDPPASQPAIDGAKRWSSKDPNGAIGEFVSLLMGFTSADPRAMQATSLLQAHFASAMQQGAKASDALRSTFITACTAPSSISIGL